MLTLSHNPAFLLGSPATRVSAASTAAVKSPGSTTGLIKATKVDNSDLQPKQPTQTTKLQKTNSPIASVLNAIKDNRSMRRTPDVLFLWIPKSSGTTVFSRLREDIGLRKFKTARRFLAFPNRGALTPGHVHWLSLLEAGLVSPSYHERAFKFTIVRDPYTRSVSLYNYLRGQEIIPNMSFDRFLETILTNRPPIGLYNAVGLSQTNPQCDWLLGRDGEFLVDKIYKLESRAEMHDDLRSRYGVVFQNDAEEKHNVSQKYIPYDRVFESQNRIDIINEVYRKDFMLLGYDMR